MTLPIYDKGFTQEEIDFGLEQFVIKVNDMITKHREVNFPTLPAERIIVKPGRTYWKLVKEQVSGSGQRFVYCFVRKADGAVLKAASWRAPALNHARSFVTDSDYGMSGVGIYGTKYMT
jgi:hypothetical protein